MSAIECTSGYPDVQDKSRAPSGFFVDKAGAQKRLCNRKAVPKGQAGMLMCRQL